MLYMTTRLKLGAFMSHTIQYILVYDILL